MIFHDNAPVYAPADARRQSGASSIHQANKLQYKSYCDKLRLDAANLAGDASKTFFSADAQINISAPFDLLSGSAGMIDTFFQPILTAMPDLYRRTDLLFAGHAKGGDWVTGHGHYVGSFQKDWMGIPATGQVIFLRYGEFHRMEDGRAIESYIFVDLIDLLRQIGRWPLTVASVGEEFFIPGPITGDGLIMDLQDASESEKSVNMVFDMLKQLYTEDEAWRPYWHQNMMWYGPAGYGSYIGLEGFARFQMPYESVFDPRRKGEAMMTCPVGSDLDLAVKGHFTRFGDGNYVASGGWPSHGGHLAKDWLGVKAEGQMFTARVADWWRREGDLLVENWVFVDLIDMLRQLDYDVFDAADVKLVL